MGELLCGHGPLQPVSHKDTVLGWSQYREGWRRPGATGCHTGLHPI